MPSIATSAFYALLISGLLVACDADKPAPVQPVKAATAANGTAVAPAAPTTDTYDLRGAPVKGATRRSEMDMQMTDAQMTFKAGELSFSGTMTQHLQNTDDLEILEVEGSQVRKGRLSHVLDKVTTRMHMTMPDGSVEDETSDDNGELHGRVETIEQVGGQWRRALEGAPANVSQSRLLTDPPIYDAMYPTAVKIGESWTQTGPELRRWLGGDFTSASGEIKNTLLAVELQQGEKIALIESIGEIRGTMLDDENREVAISMGVRGTTRRSLDRAVDLEATSEGAMKLSGELVQDGVAVTMAVTGRYKVRITGTLR